MKYAVALVVALLLNAAANLMIKFGMKGIDEQLAGAGMMDGGVVGLVRLVLDNWILVVGLVCFGLNVVFYAFAMQKLPISVAYPIMTSCGFAIIITVAGLVLHERLTAAQWVGVVAILIGVMLVAKDAGRQLGGPVAAETPAAQVQPPAS